MSRWLSQFKSAGKWYWIAPREFNLKRLQYKPREGQTNRIATKSAREVSDCARKVSLQTPDLRVPAWRCTHRNKAKRQADQEEYQPN